MLNHNILGGCIPVEDVDFILIGDMFYDSSFSNAILSWLLKQKKKSRVLIGDPGRHGLKNAFSQRMKLRAEYPLMDHTVMENNGFKTSCVWELLWVSLCLGCMRNSPVYTKFFGLSWFQTRRVPINKRVRLNILMLAKWGPS